MGMLIRLLLTKLLPARLAWVVAAFALGRVLAARQERTRGITSGPPAADG